MEAEVILVGTKFPGNIGSVSRVMANFGLEKLILVRPGCDYLSCESRKFAKNSQKILENARIVSSLDELENLTLIGTTGKTGFSDNVSRFYITPKELAFNLKEESKIGIVFGNEESGLSADEIKKCSFLVHIPADKNYPVLNISHSTAIILYELFNSKFEKRKTAGKREIQSVSLMAGKIADEIYGSKAETPKKVFDNLIKRAVMQKLEARTLAGFFRKIYEKIQFENKRAK